MQIVVIECDYCKDEFETEDNSKYFDYRVCRVCYAYYIEDRM